MEDAPLMRRLFRGLLWWRRPAPAVDCGPEGVRMVSMAIWAPEGDPWIDPEVVAQMRRARR